MQSQGEDASLSRTCERNEYMEGYDRGVGRGGGDDSTNGWLNDRAKGWKTMVVRVLVGRISEIAEVEAVKYNR